MQTKVSMVVPCYNKVDYIDDMLRSVFDQEWDNIELILVDSSTDGTSEIIDDWKPKLNKRGYNVIVIYQERKGIGTAVKTGLMRATGEYICMPDCDDTLSPYYVSHMAEVLDRDSTVEWVWCNVAEDSPLLKINNKDRLLQLLLLHKYARWSVWSKMTRASYIKKCRVLDTFIESYVTQEPQVIIPLAAAGAWPYMLCEKLYFYNHSIETSISVVARKSYVDIIALWNGYKELFLNTLNALGHNGLRRQGKPMYSYENNIKNDFDKLNLKYWKQLLENMDCIRYGNAEDLLEMPKDFAFREIFDIAIDEPLYMTKVIKNTKRIIFCCCLGKLGRVYLPKLIVAGLKPNILWDAKAEHSHTDYGGIKVTTPEYSDLTNKDVVLILSSIGSNIFEIRNSIGGKCSFFTLDDVRDYIRWRFYKMNIKRE